MTWLFLLAVAVAALVVYIAYFLWFFRWVDRATSGDAYFARPVAERRALKRRIRMLAGPARPLASMMASGAKEQKGLPGFEFEGVWGPTKVATPEVFARAKAYVPQAEDVFVATQMRCGTTWMQQVVYQVVTHGRGDFDGGGPSHIYGISPWIDATHGVSMADAPLVGSPPVRIIKTHLPVELCPYSPTAKYIYVARHPVSCFASIVDFNRTMLGPFLPSVEALAGWYCSDRMYWLPWPRHVEGYWQWAQRHPNVLFVHYEQMIRDFGAELDRICAFLGHELTAEERARVIEKTSFNYMKQHEDYFEMAPPSMFSVSAGQFLASGREHRHEDVTPAVKQQILEYCRASMKAAEYPAATFYPDLS